MHPFAKASAVVSGAAEPTHEIVYQQIRDEILFGGLLPGHAVTLRGIASKLGVSPMPVREAVRRLIAERALQSNDSRRVSVPPMTQELFEQISFARLALEPDLATRALPNCDRAVIQQLQQIDREIDAAMHDGDVERYMRGNHAFHFALYRRAEADTLLGLVDALWLQIGPFMRVVCGRFGTLNLQDQHQATIAALRARDADALRQAVAADIGQGLDVIASSIETAGRSTAGLRDL